MPNELELTPEEIDTLFADSGKPRAPAAQRLVRLRDSHHWLARAIAQGKPYNQVAFECGYSISRISILMADPTFQALVSEYRRILTPEDLERGLENRAMMESNWRKSLRLQSDMLDEIAEAHEEEGRPLPQGVILDNVVSLADRLGHGKSRTNVNVDATGIAEQIAAARRRYLDGVRQDRLDLEPPAAESSTQHPTPKEGEQDVHQKAAPSSSTELDRPCDSESPLGAAGLSDRLERE